MTWKSLQNAISGTTLWCLDFFWQATALGSVMIRMMLSELMVGTCFVLDRVFSFLRFIVYFLIPSFSLGLQTLVAVGVGSVCDT